MLPETPDSALPVVGLRGGPGVRENQLMPEATVARGTLRNTSKLKQNSISGHITHKTQFGQERFAGQTILILEHNMGACLLAFRGKKGFLKKDTKSQKKGKSNIQENIKTGNICSSATRKRKTGRNIPSPHIPSATGLSSEPMKV